jgi:hypothetical protein
MIEKDQIDCLKKVNLNTKEMMKITVNSHNKNGLKTSGTRQNDSEENKNLSKNQKRTEPNHKTKNPRINKKINKNSNTPEEEKRNPRPPEKVTNFRDRGQYSGKSNKTKEIVDLSTDNPFLGVPSQPNSANKQNKKLLPSES